MPRRRGGLSANRRRTVTRPFPRPGCNAAPALGLNRVMTVPSPASPTPSAESSWRAAWERHGASLLDFLRRRTRRREDAEDLLQEAFAKAIRARPEGLPDDALRPYLFATAQHLLADRRERQGEVLFSEVAAPGHELDPIDARIVSPEDRAASGQLRSRLRETLGQLPPAHRTAYELAVLGRLPYEEVRRRTGWSAEAVRVNVHRARRRVLSELAAELEGAVS